MCESNNTDAYKLLIDLEKDSSIPKAEVIRSKLIQLNASKDDSNCAQIESIKRNLTKQLFAVSDSPDNHNKLSEAVEQLCSRAARPKLGRTEWKCGLNDLTDEQMKNRFKFDRNAHQTQDKLVVPFNMSEFIKSKANTNECVVIDIASSDSSAEDNNSESQIVVDNNNADGCGKSVFKSLKHFDNLKNENRSAINKCVADSTNDDNKLAHKSQPKRKICSSPSGLFKKSAIYGSPNRQNANLNKNITDRELGEPFPQHFMSGLEKQIVDRFRKNGDIVEAKKSLNASRQQFKPPYKYNKESDDNVDSVVEDSLLDSLLKDDRVKNIDPKMVELIRNEIIDSNSKKTEWNDIAGLENVKKKVKEILVLPLLRPDLFTGIRTPPKGLLLFGPPGTGKTLIGRCVASQSNSTFFSITASSLTSKWVGVGEKMVRAMFAVARVCQPSVIFIDEIDSLLTQRNDSEHESSRRLKTEFLAQFDGVNTSSEDSLLIIGATNRPQELDDAARRRFTARIYIPLPDNNARKQIIQNCIKDEKNSLTEEDLVLLSEKTDGYSGADMFNLCRESAMESYRDDSLLFDKIDDIEKDEIRPINYNDFVINLEIIRPSVCNADLKVYDNFNNKFGTNLQKK